MWDDCRGHFIVKVARCAVYRWIIPTCNLGAQHFLVSPEITDTKFSSFNTFNSAMRHVKESSASCMWVDAAQRGKEKREINLEDESPFKNRTHKSSAVGGLVKFVTVF